MRRVFCIAAALLFITPLFSGQDTPEEKKEVIYKNDSGAVYRVHNNESWSEYAVIETGIKTDEGYVDIMFSRGVLSDVMALRYWHRNKCVCTAGDKLYLFVDGTEYVIDSRNVSEEQIQKFADGIATLFGLNKEVLKDVEKKHDEYIEEAGYYLASVDYYISRYDNKIKLDPAIEGKGAVGFKTKFKCYEGFIMKKDVYYDVIVKLSEGQKELIRRLDSETGGE